MIKIRDRKAASLLLALPLVASLGCSEGDDATTNTANTGSSTTAGTSTTAVVAGSTNISDGSVSGAREGGSQTGAVQEDTLVASDFATTVTITYSGATASYSALPSGVSITQSGADIVVNSTLSGVNYVLRGSSANGSLKVYSDSKYMLTLNNLSLQNDGPALNLQSTKRAYIYLAPSSVNSLSDAATYGALTAGEGAKGTIFAEGKILFSGSGKLSVAGLQNHAIASDDYVRLSGGEIVVSSAVKDGIHANDAFYMDGGSYTASVTSDGIEVEKGHIVINAGTLNLTAGSDGITASYDTDSTIDPYVTLNGGSFTIKASEGIESKSTLTINGGSYTINTSDDGLNAAAAIYFNGGEMYVRSTGNDGVDSNGTLTITGGRIISLGASSPEAAFDSDRNQFKITGGTVLGLAGGSSIPTASVSTQHIVMLPSQGQVGQLLHIASAQGQEALTLQIPQSFATLLYSSAKLKPSTSYHIYSGGTVASGEAFGSWYYAGTYSGGRATGTSFSTSTRLTNLSGRTR